MHPIVYVGFDPRETVAYRVCVDSMMSRASRIPMVCPISATLLGRLYSRPTTRRNGVRWDEISGQPMSTDFSLARFWVPVLAMSGWVLFCDCDFLWRGDVAQLFALADDRFAVMVVKHQHAAGDTVKMDAQVQTYYQRKNWSSCMLINCSAPEWAGLDLARLNTMTKHQLHCFEWIAHARMGELPLTWNWLAGVNDPPPDPGPRPCISSWARRTCAVTNRRHTPKNGGAMRSGKLRQRVVLYDLVETQDGLGGVVSGWGNERSRWEEADMIGGREYMGAQGVAEWETTRFVIRYDATISQTSKIVWRGQDYFVTQSRDVMGAKRTLEVIASRRKPQ